MDRKPPEDPEVQRLIRISEASRACLASEVSDLRRRLDLPARLRESLRRHPSTWLYGSLASGFAASLLFRRRPAREKKRRGISRTLIGLTLTAARPLAKVWLGGQLKQWAAGVLQGTHSPSLSSNQLSPRQPNANSPGPGSR